MPLFTGIKSATEPNQLFVSLEKKEWKRAIGIAKRSPNLTEQTFMMKKFYGKTNTVSVNALQMACKHQAPPEVVEAIIAASPNLVTATDALYRRNAVHVATIFGAPSQTVQALLRQSPKSASTIDKDGRLPIHFACGCLVSKEAEKRNTLRILLKANPDSARIPESKEGFVPLHVACQSAGSQEVIRILVLAAPESVFSKSRQGFTPIDCAKAALKRGDGMMDEERIGFLERFSEESSSQGFQLKESAFEKEVSSSNRTASTAFLSSESLSEASDDMVAVAPSAA